MYRYVEGEREQWRMEAGLTLMWCSVSLRLRDED